LGTTGLRDDIAWLFPLFTGFELSSKLVQMFAVDKWAAVISHGFYEPSKKGARIISKFSPREWTGMVMLIRMQLFKRLILLSTAPEMFVSLYGR
jgi:hypothetical protein